MIAAVAVTAIASTCVVQCSLALPLILTSVATSVATRVVMDRCQFAVVYVAITRGGAVE